MIRYIVFLAAFVASAVAIPTVLEETVKTANCCLPNQFSANLTALNTIGKYCTTLDVQIDFGRKLHVYKNHTLGSKTPSSTVLIDYGQGKMFLLLAIDPINCYERDVNFPLLQCIPEDAEYIGSTYMGPKSGRMPFDVWQFQGRSPGNVQSVTVDYTVAATQSKNGCVPLLERTRFSDYTPDHDYLITEFKTYLTDPSLFTLPKSCLNPIRLP